MGKVIAAPGQTTEPKVDLSKFQFQDPISAGNDAWYGSPNFADQGKSKYDNAKSFIDPNYIDTKSISPEDSYRKNLQQLEGGRDTNQPWYDKVGNGLGKFGGTLAASVLSVPGTIFGLATMPFSVGSSLAKGESAGDTVSHALDPLWDNVFQKMANDITDYTNENLVNHRSVAQQNASPWSPTYWANLNFFTDQVLGNAGYAVGAYLTGGGVSKALQKLAPLLAAGRLKQGLDLMKEGVDLEEAVRRAGSAVRTFDKVQAGISLGISSMSEASQEAKSAHDEFVRAATDKLTDHYGGEENIPASELDAVKTAAEKVGNITYGLNVPILFGTDALQFGKSLLGFKTEANAMRKEMYDIAEDGTIGMYKMEDNARKLAAKGNYSGKILAAFKNNIIPSLRNNLEEASQEGFQYIASEGTKNYYGRRFDPQARHDTTSLVDSYADAVNTLFTTQEGAANMLAGFFTPMFMPVGPGGVFNHKDVMKMFLGDKGERLKSTNSALSILNGANIKSNFKEAFETLSRDRSIQRDMNNELQAGNDLEARNLENDRVKNVINSRIKAGRYDLLQKELDKMMQMSGDDFKTYLGLADDVQIDHKAELQKYKNRAKDMYETYTNLDVLFRPALYHLNDIDDEKRKAAMEHLDAYKEMAWSYLMDAKDATQRERKLQHEVDTGASGLFTVSDLFGSKTGDDKLNNHIDQYNESYLAYHLKKAVDPKFEDSTEAKFMQARVKSMKGRVREYIKENPASLKSLPDYAKSGDPNFLEDFLFDLEKKVDAHMKEGNMNRVFGKEFIGSTKNAVYDINDFLNKVHDYRRLGFRRMTAINAYNNLATVVKDGSYRDAYVKNPDYETDKTQPQYILNTQFLETDHYKKIKDWRKEYETQQQQQHAQNEQEANQLQAEMERATTYEGSDAKDFTDQVNAHHADEMDDQQMKAFHDGIVQEMTANNITGKYNFGNKAVRDTFDRKEYIAHKAKIEAFNRENNSRAQAYEDAVQTELRKVDEDFRKIYASNGIAEANQHIDLYKKNLPADINPDFVSRLDEIINQTRSELLKPEESESTIVPITGTTGVQETPKPVRTPGATITSIPEGSSEVTMDDIDNANYNARLQADALSQPQSDTYLTVRRSDLQTQKQERFYKLRDVTKMNDQGVIKVGDQTSEYTKTADHVQIKGGKKYTIAEFSKYLQEHSVTHRAFATVNTYDKNNRVVTNQFNPALVDPSSPLYLHPGRPIRIVKVTSFAGKKSTGIVKATGFPIGKYQVQDAQGNWVDTGFEHEFNPDKVDAQAGIENIPEKVRDNVRAEVAAVAKELLAGKVVNAVIKDSGVGIGKLVMNKGERGDRERFSLFDAFGSGFINTTDPSQTGRVLLGTIYTDNGTDSTIVQMQGSNIIDVADIDGVEIPQGMIDALTRDKLTGKPLNKAGQMVALLPTAQQRNGRMVHMPIMLNTRNTADDVSSAYTAPDGSNMSIGEALLDTLLNPGNPSNRTSIAQLFDLVGLKYDPASPNWEAFYTNENIYAIVNRVFHASAKTIGNVKYKYPLAISVLEKADGGGGIALEIDITKDVSKLSKARKKAYVHITHKDGKLNLDDVEKRMKDYFAHSKESIPFEYQDVLDVIKSKPYRVDMGLASLPASGQYQSIEFNDEDKISVNKYDSYLHYLNTKQILQSTVQGIAATVNGKNSRFYFVNQQIRYDRLISKQQSTPIQITPKGAEPLPGAAQGQAQAPVSIGTGTFVPGQFVGIEEAPKSAAMAHGKVPSSESVSGDPMLDAFNDLISGKPATKAMMDFTAIVTVNQMTIPGQVERYMPTLIGDVNKMMIDTLIDQYNSKKTKFSTNRNRLKAILRKRLEDSIVELNKVASESLRKGEKDATIAQRIAARQIILKYFDSSDFEKTLTAEEREKVQYGERKTGEDKDGNPIYEPNYFIGFFNIAVNELFRTKIITAHSNGQEEIVFHDEDQLGYNTRFNDNWSFEIDPRDTLGKYAKVIMSTVPKVNLDTDGNVTYSRGPLGEQEYLNYETVYSNLINLLTGVSVDDAIDTFASIGAKDPSVVEVDGTLYMNPTLRALYMKLAAVRSTYGNATYIQQLRQLLNPSLLQQVNYKVQSFRRQTGNNNATYQPLKLSRQMINHHIVQIWSQNLSRIIKGGRYVQPFESKDQSVGGLTVTNYKIKPVEYSIKGQAKTGSMVEYLTDKINEAGDLSTKAAAGAIAPRYLAFAKIYVDDLGFTLSEDGTVEGTAKVLQLFDRKKKGSNEHFFHREFPGGAKYGFNLKQFIQHTLVEYIAQPIQESLSTGDDVYSTFNPGEPLGNSNDILNRYAKLTKGNFQDIVNTTVRDSEGKSNYIFAPRNNLSSELIKLKNTDYLWSLANTIQGRNHPVIGNLFKKDAQGDLISKDQINEEEMGRWMDMDLDYLHEMDNGRQSVKARGATQGTWDLMSLASFQNIEKTNSRSLGKSLFRPAAEYLMEFGDASTAPYFRFTKHRVAFDMDENNKFSIRLKEGSSEERISQVPTIMREIYRSDIHRAFTVIQQYKAAKQSGDFSQLQYGYHYVLQNGKYGLGPGGYIFSMGNNIYDELLSENSFLFTTATANGSRYITGIKEHNLNKNGQPQIIDQFLDDHVERMINDMVTDKMTKLEPFMEDLLRIDSVKQEDGEGLKLTGFGLPLFDNDYVRSFMYLAGNGAINVGGTNLAELFKEHKDNRVFTADNIKTDSYPAILLRAMIADHQINHFIFRSTFNTAFAGDPGFYQKPGKAGYHDFYDNFNKRAKRWVTPLRAAVMGKQETANIVSYNDIAVGHVKNTISEKQYNEMKPLQKKMVEFLRDNHAALKEFVTNNADGTVRIPQRTFGHTAEAILALQADKWADQGSDTNGVKEVINQLLSYWSGLQTDGHTNITLREYLYRILQDGKIDDSDFNRLLDYFQSPNLVVNDKTPDEVLMQGMKYVGTGSKIENGLLIPIYKKDGEFVMIPAMTKMNPWLDALRTAMEAKEGKGINPGIIAAPISSMKLGASVPIDTIDEDGNILIDNMHAAPVIAWSRSILGQQVQNPDKELNETTSSTQAEKFIHYNVSSLTRFGGDVFEKVPDYDDLKGTHFEDTLARSVNESKPKTGISNREMMRNKHHVKGELMLRAQQDLMSQWALRYNPDNSDYNTAVASIIINGHPLDATDPEHYAQLLDILKQPGDPNWNLALQAKRLRNTVISTQLQNMLEHIKLQAFARKGVDINNAFALKLVEGMSNVMEIPTTFVASTVQFQSVILSQINQIIMSHKLPGSSLVQMSGHGYTRGKVGVQADNSLRGYTAIYDEKGKVTGLTPAEVVYPWRITDPQTGKLLDYDKYVDEHGVPRKDMWDDEMLNLVLLRIPGTGVNTMGRGRIVKFFRPGSNRDMIAVAPEVEVQMNSDNDFDKMPTYMYYHKVDPVSGKITKIQGFLNASDKRIKDHFTEEHYQNARRAALLETDPNYNSKLQDLERLVNAKISQISSDIEDQDVLDEIRDMDLVERMEYIQARLDLSNEQMQPLVKAYQDIQRIEETTLKSFMAHSSSAGGFNFTQYLKENPDGIYKMQSSKELKNALVESYHMMLSHMDVAPRMLDPLTTQWVSDHANAKDYTVEGKQVSLREIYAQSQFYSVNSESSQSQMRVANAGADVDISMLANLNSVLHLAQQGKILLGMEREKDTDEVPAAYRIIQLKYNDGETIEESPYNWHNSPVTKHEERENLINITSDPYGPVPMSLYGSGTVPYRLDRFYGHDATGKQLYVSSVLQSTLQSALDNQKDPLVGILNINPSTIPAVFIMAGLRYFDHLIPFINQPVIREYIIEQQRQSSPISDLRPGSTITEDRYRKMAGLKQDDREPLMDITPNALKEAITQMASTQTLSSAYYAFQLNVLRQFKLMDAYGRSAIEMQRNLNVDTKGIKGTTLAQVEEQLDKFGDGNFRKMLNGEFLRRSPLFNHSIAYDYGLKMVRDLFEHGRIGMFSDLKPAMKTMRSIFPTNKRVKANIQLRQFLLSNPEIFKEIIAGIESKGFKASDAAAIREKVMKEQFAVKDGMVDLGTQLNKSLATLIDELQTATDKNGQSYKAVYEILSNLKPIPQSNNTNVSLVNHLNSNNYKKNLDLLQPASIMRMLSSGDARLEKVARYLILYGYMAGGTDGPLSFIRSLPQEVLVKSGFGAVLRETMKTLDNAFSAMMHTFYNNEDQFQDPRPYNAKLLSGDYTKGHRFALNMLRSFSTQYAQHNPFDYAQQGRLEDKFEHIGSGLYQQKQSDEEESPSQDLPAYTFLTDEEVNGKKIKKPTVLINNWDGTFSEVDRLGLRRFNMSEYSYNTKGAAGRSVINSNKINPSMEQVDIIPIHKQVDYATIVPFRFENRAISDEEINAQVSTVPKMLVWSKAYSDFKASDVSNEKVRNNNKAFSALSEYLVTRMPKDLRFSYDTELTHNGQPATAVVDIDNTNKVTGMRINPSRIGARGDEEGDFRYALLHESAHIATSQAVDMVRMVNTKTLTREAAADRLHMKAAEFERVMKAVSNLDTLLNLVKSKRADFNPFFRSEEDQRLLNNAFKNTEEFIATIFADARFRDALNKIDLTITKRQRKSIWQRIKELFADLLGIREGSALHDAFYNIMEITESYHGELKADLSADQASAVRTKALQIAPRQYMGKGLTKDYRIDKYIEALSETRSNLSRQLAQARTDLTRLQQITNRIEEIDRHIALLKGDQNTSALVETGKAVLSKLQIDLDRITSYADIHEGMRLSKAYSEIHEVLDFMAAGLDKEEQALIEDAKTIRSMATDIFKSYLDKFKEKVKTDMDNKLGAGAAQGLFNQQGDLVIADINKVGTLFISGAYSSNKIEQYVDAVLREAENKAHDEYYAFETDLAKQVKTLTGKHLEKTDHHDFSFLTEKNGNITQLVTHYDRQFYKDLYTNRHLAFDKKKGDNYAMAKMLGVADEDMKKKMTPAEYYAWEKNHFDYELSEEGKQEFERHMEEVKLRSTSFTAEGEEVYDQQEYDREYARYDPEQFQRYLNGDKGVRYNKGSRWFTKHVKTTVPISKGYQKMSDAQKAFYSWFTEQVLEGRQDLAIDHRFNATDLDGLLLDTMINTAGDLGEKMQYMGQEFAKFVNQIGRVGYMSNEKMKTPARTLTGMDHLGIEFKDMDKFAPEDKSTMSVNPIEILQKFRLASHVFARHREVEDQLNAARDLAFGADKASQMPDGRFRQNILGALATSKSKTNVADRVDFTIKSKLTGRVKEALPPTDGSSRATQPGEKRFSIWKVIDDVNDYTRFKAMALSPMSGFGNLAMGSINNFIYAASGQYFNDKELTRAYSILRGSIAKYWSHDIVETNDARKIAEILFRYNVIGDVTEKQYHDGDLLARFYTLTKSGEFMNQGATSLAQMLRRKVKLADGTEKSVWDLFKLDENGKVHLQKELLNENDPWHNDKTMYDFMDVIKRVNDKIHGDYRNPLQVKKDLYGRVLLMFRTWLPMAVKERFGAEYEDAVLGAQKGRYLSVGQLAAKATKKVARTLFGHKEEGDPIGELFGIDQNGEPTTELQDFGKLVARLFLPFIGKKVVGKFGNSVSEIDVHNLNMFVREVHFMMVVGLACLALSAMIGGTGDDKEKKKQAIIMYMLNNGSRMESELRFFLNPSDQAQILRDIIPMYSTVRESQKVISRTFNFLTNPESDVYKTGIRKGKSKLWTATQDLVPVTRSIEKTWSASAQVFNSNRFQ